MKNNVLYSIPCVCALLFVGMVSLVSSDSAFATASASLMIGNNKTSESLSTTITQGSTAYLSSTIKATTTDTESYTLTINGPVGLSGGSNISGASGNKPISMPNNSWGYAYNDSNSNENKTYKSFTGSNQELEKGTLASSVAKNITFAAKFASDAAPGHYTATVKVNLVATPKRAIFDGITTMQEMTPAICSAAAQNETKQLKDTRDNKLYWVTKLKDNNCWMTQNLDYDGGGDKRATLSEWVVDDNNSSEYWDPGSKIGNGQGETATSTTDQHLLAGNYYSYAAALTVCPSGWRLPTSNSTTVDGSFGKLLARITSGSTINTAPYYFQYGGAITSKWGSTAIFTSGAGQYWSSTPNANYNAYILTFGTSDINPSYPQTDYGRGRSNGLSVRCLATSSVSYSITYDPGNSSTVGVTDGNLTSFNEMYPTQTSPTNHSGASYTFTIPSGQWSGLRKNLTDTAGTSGSIYQVTGWNIVKDSSTIQYAPGATITVNSSTPHIILYPVWKATGGGVAI